MRVQGYWSYSSFLLLSLLVPATASAAWDHSWCVPGGPLTLPAPSGTDATLVKIVTDTCSAHSECCNSNGRWALACVQRAAAYAKQQNLKVNGKSDYCGRYSWAQTFAGYQAYPRDINVMALNGDISNFTDAQGPLVASGNVSASSFALNGGESNNVALVANGNVDLARGSVYGAIWYGGSYNLHGSVALIDPQDHKNPPAAIVKKPGAIDFNVARSTLAGMSTQISAYYPSRVIRKVYQAITFGGSNLDPELNVFTLDASQLSGATSFVFAVPSGSFVIINVTGTNPNFFAAGFSGPNGGPLPTKINRILWNFPQATALTISSVGFAGTILAPSAAATFQSGSISGTAVVKSAKSSSELYMAPYEVPGPGGCLWADSTWSCANDTTLDDSQHVARLAPEAGFLEIEGGDYIAEGINRSSPTHRVWYAFQPAQSTPKDRALAVFFNGGPGASTSGLLFSFNTSTWTLDPDAMPNNVISYNANAWTKFANLLYIDAPGTGFSYSMPHGGTQQPIGMDIDRDAGVFIRVITRFLARHPDLRPNPVILVGESYGGTRATLMLKYLLGYVTLMSGDYQDPQVYDGAQLKGDLLEYFQAVFKTPIPALATVATKFGNQVLMSPGIAGQHQQSKRKAMTNCAPPLDACKQKYPTLCPARCYESATDNSTNPPTQIYPTCDPYACDKPNSKWPAYWEWTRDQQEAKASDALNVVANLNRAIGVDATTIAWMKAENRQGAYGRSDGFSSSDMKAKFDGTKGLGADDTYFVKQNYQVFCGYYGCTVSPPYTKQNHARQWSDSNSSTLFYPYPTDAGLAIGTDFLNNVRVVASMISATKFDTVIQSPSIEYGLADGSFSSTATNFNYDPNYSTCLKARPGAMTFSYVSGGAPGLVPMPNYVSGHTVVMRAPAEALADVMQWYVDSPHSGPPYHHN